MIIYTIGHSTRSIKEFIELLKINKVQLLIDVRSVPYSTYNPQYNKDKLQKSIERNKMQYVHMSGLGGFRNPLRNSINMAWKNKRFRGYADYMQTKEFKNNLSHLIDLAKQYNVAIMCSEAVPWRCHRSLIADALTIRKIKVFDIFNKTTNKQHKLTSFAKVKGKNITYP